MPNIRNAMPLLLRPEHFGGIVFDPRDGTLLHLDHEGYRVARLMLSGKQFFVDPAKRAFSKKLKNQLTIAPSREFHEATPPAHWNTAVNIPSLSAPTLVDFQITNQCNMGCPHCYAGSTPDGKHVPWHELKRVIKQLNECGVCQLAIGGGEPLLHPNITDLLYLCCENHIVPNMTTGGMDFNEQNLTAIKECCGAIGLSLEATGTAYDRVRGKLGFKGFEKALQLLKEWNIPTVLQIVLSEDNFAELPKLVDYCLGYRHLYGVIFLAYKPVGRGKTFSRPLSTLPSETVKEQLALAFKKLSANTRVGYDCCMTPAVAGIQREMPFSDLSHLEGCSGMRGSCGVLPNLDVIPCTFTPNYTIGNLADNHILETWQSPVAESFRRKIFNRSITIPACASCSMKEHCYAGCPVMDLIKC